MSASIWSPYQPGVVSTDQVMYTQGSTGSVTRTTTSKLQESASLEDFGASEVSTALQNAAAFVAAIQSGKRITPPVRTYTFQFDGYPITVSAELLDLDLGPYKHTFLNFGGLLGDSVKVLRYNGRFTASSGYCRGFGSFRRLQSADIGTIEITDVYCDTPTVTTQFFGLEFAGDAYGDNDLVINIENAVFKNIITETGTVASGNAIPMTGFGNYDSFSLNTKRHLLNFGNLYIENLFSVTTDGVTIIDGDSDFFRIFTNPTLLTIENCTAINVGKRFIKTQERAEVVVSNLVASLDSRFTNTNFIGFFEGQATAQTSGITKFTVMQADVQFSNNGATQKLLFNASGLDHEMYVYNMTYSNIGAYAPSENVTFYAENIKGSKLFINTPSSTRLTLKNFEDTNLVQIRGAATIDGFVISFSVSTATFVIQNGILKNGSFEAMDVNTRIAQVRGIQNVTVNYTTGTVARRPFRPSISGDIVIEGLTVNSIGPSTQTFDNESFGGSGTFTIRNYKSVNQTLAFFPTGSSAWSFVLDNCADDTVTGAGVASVKRSMYNNRLYFGSASLAFGSIPAHSSRELTITITGAAVVGDAVFVSPEGVLADGLSWAARVSSANTVSVRVLNATAGALVPATVVWRAVVFRF